MAGPLRHRQTKGAETAMVSLQPPRHIPTLPCRCIAGKKAIRSERPGRRPVDARQTRAAHQARHSAGSRTATAGPAGPALVEFCFLTGVALCSISGALIQRRWARRMPMANGSSPSRDRIVRVARSHCSCCCRSCRRPLLQSAKLLGQGVSTHSTGRLLMARFNGRRLEHSQHAVLR